MPFEKVTIGIGATDESETLIKTVDTIFEICDDRDIAAVLVIIPENVTDECFFATQLLKKRYPAFVREVVQNGPHIGGAIRSCIEATESSHIMFLSADIPIELDSIPVMIEQSKKSPDSVVKVSRWLKHDSFYGYNRTRKMFNALAQSFLRILFNAGLTDFTAPVLTSPTEIYKNIIFKEWRFPCFLEMVLVPVRMQKKFIEVPAKCFSRTEGKSKNSVLQTAMYLKTALRIRLTPKEKIYRSVD